MSGSAAADRPWIMRTYSGHSSAAASNELYRTNLAKGQTGLSVAFDLPTQTGYDSDHPLARGEVGKVGVPIDSFADSNGTVEEADVLYHPYAAQHARVPELPMFFRDVELADRIGIMGGSYGGFLTAYDLRTAEVRTFTVARITGVAAVADPAR